jgi:hypothetical protein
MNYEEACARAATRQGLDPVIETLTAAGLDADAVNTGGFTMVACVYRPGTDRYVGITAYDGVAPDPDTYLVCGYDDAHEMGDADAIILADGNATLAGLADLVRGWLYREPVRLTPTVRHAMREAAGALMKVADAWTPQDQAAFDDAPAHVRRAFGMSIDEMATELFVFSEGEVD